MQGGFSRPEFTPGLGAQTPRVGAHIAEADGSRADIAEREEDSQQERMQANRRRRRQLLIAAAVALVVMALIVAGVVYFWAGDPYAPDPTTL